MSVSKTNKIYDNFKRYLTEGTVTPKPVSKTSGKTKKVLTEGVATSKSTNKVTKTTNHVTNPSDKPKYESLFDKFLMGESATKSKSGKALVNENFTPVFTTTTMYDYLTMLPSGQEVNVEVEIDYTISSDETSDGMEELYLTDVDLLDVTYTDPETGEVISSGETLTDEDIIGDLIESRSKWVEHESAHSLEVGGELASYVTESSHDDDDEDGDNDFEDSYEKNRHSKEDDGKLDDDALDKLASKNASKNVDLGLLDDEDGDDDLYENYGDDEDDDDTEGEVEDAYEKSRHSKDNDRLGDDDIDKLALAAASKGKDLGIYDDDDDDESGLYERTLEEGDPYYDPAGDDLKEGYASVTLEVHNTQGKPLEVMFSFSFTHTSEVSGDGYDSPEESSINEDSIQISEIVPQTFSPEKKVTGEDYEMDDILESENQISDFIASNHGEWFDVVYK
jgi:hypothetical protein